jgi:Cu(I)/Ag(I) efflux system membrane fusion protein
VRTTRVRVPVANADGRFVPGQPGTLEVLVAARRALFVPRDAVVDTGLEKHVFVDTGSGTLLPRTVTAGEPQGERVEITRGLAAGERIVSAATFLVDSESRLRAAMGGTAP